MKWVFGGGESGVGFIVDVLNRPYIRFQYIIGSDEDKKRFDYRAELETTDCHFGGKRYWFICPLIWDGTKCRRRTGVLYLGGKYFGCRNCYDLAYQSQQEGSGGRLAGVRKFFDLSTEIEEREQVFRIRYWKGRPTKRYARFLQKKEQLRWYAGLALREMGVKRQSGLKN